MTYSGWRGAFHWRDMEEELVLRMRGELGPQVLRV